MVQPHEVNTIIMPILQVIALRLREVRKLSQDYSASYYHKRTLALISLLTYRPEPGHITFDTIQEMPCMDPSMWWHCETS